MNSRISMQAALIAFALTFATLAPAQQEAQQINSTGYMNFVGIERTPEQMEAFEGTFVPPKAQAVPFHPTMDEDEYLRIKQEAASPSGSKSSYPAPVLEGPALYGNAFSGATQNGWFPPDTEGAVGASQFVETVNSMFVVYNKNGALLKNISLNAFMGYSTTAFYDPRVMYDEVWQRWIVTAAAFPNSPTSQFYYVAISQTNLATGGWWIYSLQVGGMGGSNGLYDFPMIGVSQDAVIFTANIFTSSGFQGAALYSVAKAKLYNGLGFGVPIFQGLQATLAPPHQLDQNYLTWLAAAPPGSGNIYMYALADASNGTQGTTLSGPYTVAGVPGYSVPAGASQPVCGGGHNALDTGDNRFVNAGTQNGDLYYQAHSIQDGTATGRYYIIKGITSVAPNVKEVGTFWVTGTSSDFNVSIAADSSNEMVLNWSSVDNGSPGYYAQERFVGKQSTDPVISGGGVGASLFTSPTCLTGNYQSGFGLQRWGDYSAVTFDPVVAKRFWMINETVPNTNYWGTEIGWVHF